MNVQQDMAETTTSYPIDVPSRNRVFIGGAWVESSGSDSVSVIDPYTEQVAATVQMASSADIDRALEAARAVFDAGTWRLKPVEERARALEILADRLEERIEELAALNVIELGTPIKLARGMNASPIAQLRVIARQLRELPVRTERMRANGLISLIIREPVGVVSAIIPWNTPHNQFSFKVGPALAAGCSVVLKTASKTPLVMSAIADVIEGMTTEGIFPSGVFSLVLARHADGEKLVTDPRVDMVSFTGSTEAGRRLGALATNNLARVTLELGGKSAAIVLDDADLDVVMASLPMSGMRNSGQTCVALTRILVSRARHNEVLERLQQEIAGIVIGDPWDERTDVGPVAGASQRDGIEAHIAAAAAEGASVLRPGPEHSLGRGFYVRPTLLDGVSNDMAAAQEEIFGPVVSVIAYEDETDAVRIANDSVYGLSGAVYTADVAHGVELASQIRTGTVGVNCATFDASVPFGGYKASGVGREGGIEGLEEYFELKTIHLPAT